MPEKRTKEEKFQDREDFFKSCLGSFFGSNSAKFGEKLIKDTGKNIAVDFLADGHKIINQYYWEYIENHVRTQIAFDESKGDVDAETLVDLYKILSTTEYAVMGVRPFILTIDGKELDYVKDPDLLGVELQFTASFAFDIVRNWDSAYPDVFGNGEITEFLFNFKEKKPFRKDAMKLKEEHIATIAYSSFNNPSPPIFSNAAWWRLFCLCGVLKSENKS